MTGVKDTVLFTAIHDFLMVYLPNQQRCSPHTIRAYRYALGALLDFVTKRRNIPLSKVTFEMLDRKTIIAFLDDCICYNKNTPASATITKQKSSEAGKTLRNVLE